jgi:hypothetical protein
MSETREFFAPNPGRLDVDGIEWFKTDGFTGWYRWVIDPDGRHLIKKRDRDIRWIDVEVYQESID